jgi:chitinase
LTAAIPAAQDDYKYFDLGTLGRYFDFISIMAYDMHSSGERTTNFHSALFHDPLDPSKAPLNIHYGDYAVRDFLQAGVPPQKIVFGVPFYGKGWVGVPTTNHGLYQAATGPAKADGRAYNRLKGLLAGADRQFNTTTVSCTLWNDGQFWSYDCPEALKAKLDYVAQHHLGGIMFWELGQDTLDAELLKSFVPR